MSTRLETLKAIVKELIKKELEESSVTGAIDGGEGPPKTPAAFRKKDSKKLKKSGYEEGHKNPAVSGFSKVSEAKFHVKVKDLGSVIIDAGSKGEARMIVAKKLKGGVKKVVSVNRVAVSQAKQIGKKLENVNEGQYHNYRNDETMTPKQKIGLSMREVRDKLTELDKLVKMNVRLKNEVGVNSTDYWKNTHNAMKKISERLVKLANKVGQLY